ncbi:MAG: ferrous iron transporter B [Betaproteobacteria bacterium]|nr:ferrous iron transporter B [Betaproteobacteria bacterium]
MPATSQIVRIRTPLFRGARRLRIALVGMPDAGKRTLFDAVASTMPRSGRLSQSGAAYRECAVRIGMDEASLIELPDIGSLRELAREDLVTIQVVNATALEAHLGLTLELLARGRPMVVALNMMDEARRRGVYLNVSALGRRLGVPVVPVAALLGKGISELFAAALETARSAARPPAQPESQDERRQRSAALLAAATRPGAPREGPAWRYWLDALMLHPRWGLIGSLAVFAAVLFVVFWVGAWLDALTAARLADAAAPWQPQSAGGVVLRAVVDALIGLIGIVVPYMIPLVLLLVTLEEAGVMHRIAFVVDRAFHRIGLHGGVAVPFLTGLGCNVPAISAAARVASGHERVIASVLITFVPCSARSGIILALAGKYLGGAGVLAIFALTAVVLAILGRLLARRWRDAGPGQVQEIPPYRLPRWHGLLAETWARTRDIVTIVMPLLIGGSVVLALLHYVGADAAVNAVFTPVTSWWLGLPAVLGVPILFGILRKELSLLMIYQALGTFEVGAVLDWVQIITFLLFLTFYIPCVSTFAVMLKTIGRREALLSISLSVGVALLVSGVARLLLEGVRLLQA